MSSLVKTTINSPGHWEVMISYTQRHGESVVLAEALYHSFRENGVTVWLDIKMKKLNEAAMEEGVRNCQCVIAILSGADASDSNAYFNRDFCVKELTWAQNAGIRIQPVCAADDKKNIGSFLGQASSKGIQNLGSTDIIHLDRSRVVAWKGGFGEVLEAVTGKQLRQQSTGSGSQGETKEQKNEEPLSNELVEFLKTSKIKVTDQLTAAFNEIGIEEMEDLDDLDDEMTAALEGAMKAMEKKRFRKSLVGRKGDVS